jgi:glycosyltransferase involved in cell wall biosynthesis
MAAAVVVQTESVRGWAVGFLRADKAHVIHNPIAAADSSNTASEGIADLTDKNIFAMGRMGPEKGFDLLLEAFAKSKIAQQGWRLVILGDGKEREALLQLAERQDLLHSLLLPGTVRNPRSWFRSGGIFVLSSRFEGFPNALLEAMAEGLPAVAFDCESGPAEIVRHNVDGLLVAAGDVEGLAHAMCTLAENDELRKMMAQRAPEVLQRFALGKVSGQWEKLISRVSRHE